MNSNLNYYKQNYYRSTFFTLSEKEIYKLTSRLSTPKHAVRTRSCDDNIQKRARSTEGNIRKITVNRETINRLALPKYRVMTENCDSNRIPKKYVINKNIIETTARLSQPKKLKESSKEMKKVYAPRTPQEINQITDRLMTPIKRKNENETFYRGPPKTMLELDEFIERISTPKKVREPPVNQNVVREKRKLTKDEIDSLCKKLSDKDIARKKTPESRRLLDKSITPLNTYAWSGAGYYIDELRPENVVIYY